MLRFQLFVSILFACCATFGSAGSASSQTVPPQKSSSVPAIAPIAPPQDFQSVPQGGSSTAGVFAPVLDSEKRPITMGGFVKPGQGPILFQDIAKQSGLATWKHQLGTPEKHFIIETSGSGVGLIDYDRDGWLDIYMVNGSTYDADSGKTTPPHAALFHNNHDGTFTDVAAKAGVTNDRWGMGVAVGDFDNDGWPDMIVTNYGKNRLYHNNHDGTFTDIGEKAGITLGNWSNGPTWGDYDGDGLLDLFIPGYVHYDMAHPPVRDAAGVNINFCQYRGVATMCGPRGLLGEPDHLFHNNGDGTFTDVSERAGVADHARYYGFTAVFVDINGDGKPDLLVTNDSSPNYMYINKGDGTFEDDSFLSGFAVNEQGRDTASMGLAVGDYRNNGMNDLYTGTFSDDYKVLYRAEEDGSYTDITPEMGIAAATYPFLTWATEFIDYDNDGWKDLFVVNGHVYPEVDRHDWGTSFAERPLVFHNVDHGKKFELVPAVEGTGLADVIPGRGAAFGDLFNDGKMDVIINCIDHVPALMRNVSDDHNHWVELALVGGPGSPRDAIGTTVYLTANGTRQRGDVMSGGSYLSSNDQRQHFGLGNATKVDAVEIHWPGNKIEKVTLPAEVDRIYSIEQGKGVVPSVYDQIAAERAHPHAARKKH